MKCTTLTAKADIIKDYIGWAAGKDYAVIDVNIPKNVTIEPVSRAAADIQWLIVQAGRIVRERRPQPTHAHGGIGGISVG